MGVFLVPLAIVCTVGGVLLAGSSGVLRVIGLVLLAQGIGIGVAAGVFLLGSNPLDRETT